MELREGSLWDGVAGERFDLIATNPPFVISPPDGDLSTGQLLDALATLLARPAAQLRADYLPLVREPVAEGFLRLRDA